MLPKMPSRQVIGILVRIAKTWGNTLSQLSRKYTKLALVRGQKNP